MKLRYLIPCTLTLVVGVLAACGDDAPTSSGQFAGSCAVIASRCHPIQTTLAKECHDLGHEGDDARCGPRNAECLAECPETAEDAGPTPVDSGSPVDTDAGDAAVDAGPDAAVACAAYCTCMTATCSTEADYPFASESTCLSACAAFTPESRICYGAACEKAKTAANKPHECAHANGSVACH